MEIDFTGILLTFRHFSVLQFLVVRINLMQYLMFVQSLLESKLPGTVAAAEVETIGAPLLVDTGAITCLSGQPLSLVTPLLR